MGRNKNEDIIDKVAPHTIKKCELIEKYVDKWAWKILGFEGNPGRGGSNGVIFIDCMSNCGLYYDSNNNLVEGTAIRVAKKLNDILPNFPGKQGYVLFNDISPQKKEKLEEELSKLHLDNITVRCSCGDGNSFLRELEINSFQNQCGTLLLYDPYQATVDWDALSPFLNRWGEVIINHMVSDTRRGVASASKAKTIVKYQGTYQKDINDIIEAGKDKKGLNDLFINIIRNQSKDSKYIASFPFFTRTNGLLYNLIHISGNINGFKLFKKVAWDTFGGKSSLKDTHGNQNQLLLDFDGGGLVEYDTDDECYYVSDIAKDIIHKFGKRNDVTLKMIYQYLDVHPVFPSDGYKDEIKKELKSRGIVLPRSNDDVIRFS